MGKALSTKQANQSDENELALTPGGWRPKSKAHFIEPGHHVSAKNGKLQKIHTASQQVVADYGAVEKDKWTEENRPGKRSPNPGGAPYPDNGWIINSGWSNTSNNPISYFSTEWVVPPAPASSDEQTIFLFNGLEQNGIGAVPVGPYILQPVLQWGVSAAGGGNYWSITNWYADGTGGTALYGTLVQVNPGDTLQGIMTLTGANPDGTYNYSSVFSGQSAADLSVTDIDELTWACETLECYGITQASDYPDTIMTAMTGIEIRLGNTEATIDWATEADATENGQQCVVISNASPDGEVYLFYETDAQNFYFVVDKSTFGTDEVSDIIAGSSQGRFPNAFWLVLEGFTPNWLAGATPGFASTSSFTPTNIGGLSSISPNQTTPVEYELGGPGTAYGDVIQRIRFAYDIIFSSTSGFPPTGSEQTYTLLANLSIAGNTFSVEPETIFELVGGAVPYFTNLDPNNPLAKPYLSQDLRVFTVTAGQSPVPGAPAFTSDPYGSIQGFLYYLNNTTSYTQPYPAAGPDPLNALPNQTGYETGETSVTPLNNSGQTNYNFAIARVRLQGDPGLTSTNVRLFFRLWVAASYDTNFDPNTTYPSVLGATGADNGLPIFPLSSAQGLTDPNGQTLQTIPFFATDSTGTNDYNPTYVPPNAGQDNNIQTLVIPAGQDSLFAYFGCYLDVYNAQNQSDFPGTHHCIVAEIAYDEAPIPTSTTSGTPISPENWSQLAQRNLQITSSGNPGFPATHRIPQTFDTRPSPLPVLQPNGQLQNYPDELMIDWGNTPAGSVATIYWPQVSAADVVQIASHLYPTHCLSAADRNTIRCTVTGEVTYIPIPDGPGQNFAGLFTVDLPNGVRAGNVFTITVRRIISRLKPVTSKTTVGSGDTKRLLNWRCIAGTFQVTIPVKDEEVLLQPEENTLAILKWRLENMSPVYRWYPVVQRYIAYISARVKGMGGNPGSISASQTGIIHQKGDASPRPAEFEYTGKVSTIVFDRFGDFEGFTLLTLQGHEHSFRGRERLVKELVQQAWRERILISVFVEAKEPHLPISIVMRCIY